VTNRIITGQGGSTVNDTISAAQAEAMLPGDWTLTRESGWFPLGENGRMVDVEAWCVVQPYVMSYGNADDRINRADTVGWTAGEAVARFLAKYPTGAPKAS
jgi:hypothetical protein